MKIFVEAMDRSGLGFLYLKNTLPRISDVKINEGIFVGPQIRELMNYQDFHESLNELEKAAWNFLKNVTTKFIP